MTAPLRPPDPLSDADYRRLCDAVLTQIETTLDRWLEEDLIDIDAHRSGGLLELAFPAGTKIVLNAQPPLQELWLAARAGGYHFRYDGLAWREREGREFFELLSLLASEQAGRPLRFSPPGEVGVGAATLTP